MNIETRTTNLLKQADKIIQAMQPRDHIVFMEYQDGTYLFQDRQIPTDEFAEFCHESIFDPDCVFIINDIPRNYIHPAPAPFVYKQPERIEPIPEETTPHNLII